jgi:GTP cyclohydrolase II
MTIGPNTFEILARARNDLRVGIPIVIENTIIASAENMDENKLKKLQEINSLSIAITSWRAKTLNLAPYDQDLVRVHVPQNINAKWIKAIADPSMDLATPMKGPLKAIRDSNVAIARDSIKLAKEAQLLPSVILVNIDDGKTYSDRHNLTYLSYKNLKEGLSKATPVKPVGCAKLPIFVSRDTKMTVFRPSNGGEEHYVIEVGRPSRSSPVLTRLHSTCFTGDTLGSLKCDCGQQLNGALEQIAAYGAGLLIYLNQEGRGIGLANKIRAYSLQDQGFDTVDANHRLGFEDDERDFKIGAEILTNLGFSEIKLLTNNPRKVGMLEENGIVVTERLPLKVGHTSDNTDYLHTKVKRSGHLIE